VSAHELVAGYGGHEEAELVNDMWDLSRDRIDLPTFLARHGYHGWQEGELSSLTWRDDPSMVLEQVAMYRSRPESEDPHLAEAERSRRRVELERRFLAALPRGQRVRGRAVLALAATYLPMRGVSKVAFLQGLDVGRSAVRRVGQLLTADGALDDPADAFYLTRRNCAPCL
jgi:pyruvate,water dikinase